MDRLGAASGLELPRGARDGADRRTPPEGVGERERPVDGAEDRPRGAAGALSRTPPRDGEGALRAWGRPGRACEDDPPPDRPWGRTEAEGDRDGLGPRSTEGPGEPRPLDGRVDGGLTLPEGRDPREPGPLRPGRTRSDGRAPERGVTAEGLVPDRDARAEGADRSPRSDDARALPRPESTSDGRVRGPAFADRDGTPASPLRPRAWSGRGALADEAEGVGRAPRASLGALERTDREGAADRTGAPDPRRETSTGPALRGDAAELRRVLLAAVRTAVRAALPRADSLYRVPTPVRPTVPTRGMA